MFVNFRFFVQNFFWKIFLKKLFFQEFLRFKYFAEKLENFDQILDKIQEIQFYRSSFEEQKCFYKSSMKT